MGQVAPSWEPLLSKLQYSWVRSSVFAVEVCVLVRAYEQGRNDRGDKGGKYPGHRKTTGASKSPNIIVSTFFIRPTVHLLPKDLRFKDGGAKLVSCPRRHLPSLRLCLREGDSKRYIIPGPSMHWAPQPRTMKKPTLSFSVRKPKITSVSQ